MAMDNHILFQILFFQVIVVNSMAMDNHILLQNEFLSTIGATFEAVRDYNRFQNKCIPMIVVVFWQRMIVFLAKMYSF